MLNKNLVRVSSTSIVRSCMVKYVIVYRLLPPILARQLRRAVGVTLAIRTSGEQVSSELVFLELKDMKLDECKGLPSYYS